MGNSTLCSQFSSTAKPFFPCWKRHTHTINSQAKNLQLVRRSIDSFTHIVDKCNGPSAFPNWRLISPKDFLFLKHPSFKLNICKKFRDWYARWLYCWIWTLRLLCSNKRFVKEYIRLISPSYDENSVSILNRIKTGSWVSYIFLFHLDRIINET